MYSISQYEASSTARSKNITNKADSTIQSHLSELDSFMATATNSWNEYCRSKGLQGGIMITSGYRCPQLNSSIGGSSTSAHVHGWAADTVPVNGNYTEYFKWALEFAKSGVRFDQIIVEGTGNKKWVHFGYKNSRGDQRMQSMSYDGKKYSTISTGTPSTGSGYSNGSNDNESGIEISPNVLQELQDKENDYDWDDPELYNLSPSELDNHKYQQQSTYGMLSSIRSSQNSLSNAEKRCLYIIKKLMNKLCINYEQAAGITGNIGYETDGYYNPSKKVKGLVGLCQWDKDYQLLFNKLHYKGNSIQESTLDEQIDFLVYTLSDYIVYKIKKCNDHLSTCNYFWASYFNHKTWSELFKDLNKEEEEEKRKEGSLRRMYSDTAKKLYENNPNTNIENIGEFTGIGIDSRPVRAQNDPKIYTSDGHYDLVPAEEKEFSKEYTEEEISEEDVAYYGMLFDKIMKN